MNAYKDLVVAIDGASGSGKSSTSRGVAKALGLRYLDTGAQFRAMAVAVLRQGIDVGDPEAIAAFSSTPVIESGTDPENPTIRLDGSDVADEIRGDAATSAVSPVAAVPEVRERLLQMQRTIIAEGGIVVEGRDIGSVVAPEADLKIYLSADTSARAERRALEAGGDIDTTAAALLRRDTIDSSRAAAPLVVPEGAIRVDSTHESLEQVIARIVALAHEVEAARSTSHG